MLLRIEELGITDSGPLHHPEEEFGCLDVGSTHEHRPSGLPELEHALDHGIVLGPLGLVYEVLFVHPDDRLVGRNHDYVKLVDGPELARLGLGGTGHSGELVVHPEVVLQGDGGKGLGRILDLDILLGLHGLMESVAPAPSLHDTSRLLVDYLDLAVHDDVIHIFLEHRICLQELDHGVHALALEREFLHQGLLLLLLLHRAEVLLLYLGYLGSNIRKDEEVRVVHETCEKVVALVRHIHAVVLLADDEIEGIGDYVHLPFVVLEVVVF